MEHLPNEASKQPVRIVACYDEPLANACFESYPWNCSFPGYEIEYIHTVINGTLKLPIEWVRVENYDEIEKAMDNGEADVVGLSFDVQLELANRWGYLPAYLYDGVALVGKVNYVDSSKPFQIMGSFTWDLWLTLAVISLMIIFIRWLSGKSKKVQSSGFVECLKSNASFLVDFIRTKLFYLGWFILMSLFLNFYSNLITVTIMAPGVVKKLSFDSLDDLGEKLIEKKCRLVVPMSNKNDTLFRDYLLNPVEKHKRLWTNSFRKAFHENPPIYAESREIVASIILNSSCTVGVDWATLDDYYNSHYCDLVTVTYPEEFPLFGYTFYSTRRDIRQDLAEIITSDAFQMIPEYLTRKYYQRSSPIDCVSTSPNNRADPAISMTKMQDHFYMLCTGTGIALMLILGHYCVKFFVNRFRTHRWTPPRN